MTKLERIKDNYPIGAKVTFFPLAGSSHNEITEVRSEPWELGSGDIVIKVKGRSGGVSIDHLEVL